MPDLQVFGMKNHKVQRPIPSPDSPLPDCRQSGQGSTVRKTEIDHVSAAFAVVDPSQVPVALAEAIPDSWLITITVFGSQILSLRDKSTVGHV